MKLRCPAPQVGRFSSSSGRASVTTNSGLSRDHSSRYSTKSSSDASAHCMSSKASTVGYVSASRSKNSRHAAKRSCRSRVSLLAQAEQLREPRLDEPALLRVEQMLLQRRLQLPQRLVLRVVLGDPAAHPHHVRERPVGHALAVGEAAAAVPVDGLAMPVEVLVELPRQPRLADPGDPGHGDELRPALLGADVEQVLDLPQLAVAADERRLEPLRLQRAAHARRRRAAPATAASLPPCPSARSVPASS